ncbi:MAG TPA: hypothetical protein VGZ03_00565 [Acidimicrobiales bacterium]|nr:hypothetical protein [Acidimicrobiales bacterium]
MSDVRGERGARIGVGALGLAGLALLLAAALLAPGGAEGTVRTAVACLAVLVIPGWLVGRLADEDADALSRQLGGTVVTLAVLAVCGFAAATWSLRVATAAVAVPLLVLVAIAALLGTAAPGIRRAPLAPLVGALALGATALLGAMGTHLALPAAPVEPAFSIEAAHAVVSPTRVVVTVTVTRVRTDEPTQLTLYVNLPPPVAVALVAPEQTTVRLAARLPAGTSCRSALQLRVVASNGAFLTPPVTCVGR